MTLDRSLSGLGALVFPVVLCSTVGCGLIDEEDIPFVDDDPEVAFSCEALAHGPAAACSVGLDHVRAFVDENTIEDHGFASMPDVETLALATPLQVRHIHLTDLLSHDVTVDPETLLEGSGADEWWYVIEQAGAAVSMVGLHEKSDGWKATQIGRAEYLQTLEALRRDHAATNGKDHSDYTVVSVPALDLTFLSHVLEDGTRELINVEDHAHYPLSGGEAGSAVAFVETLVALAQARQSALGLPTISF